MYNNVFRLIGPIVIKKIPILFVLMFLSILLEMFSLSLIVPVFKMLLNTGNSSNFDNQILIHFQNYFNDKLTDINLLIILISLFIFKSLILILILIFISRFAEKVSKYSSNSLFLKYLKSNYLFLKNQNSSTILKNLNTECNQIYSFIYHINQFLIEFLICFSIFCFLFYSYPIISIYLILLLLIVIVPITLISKKKVNSIAETRIISEGNKIKNINQSLFSIREIFLYDKIDFFVNKYFKNNSDYHKSLRRLKIISGMPRYFFEVYLIVIFLLYIIFSISSGLNFVDILPLIILFSAATFRVMPSITRIIVSFQAINYSKKSVKIIEEELTKVEDNDRSSGLNNTNLIFKNKIKISNLNFSYNQNQVIKDLNLEVRKNSFNLIQGSSGKGKTTFIDILCTLIDNYQGSIKIDGIDIRDNSQQWRNKISVVPQKIYLLDDTILNNIAFGEKKEEINLERVKECLRQSGLEDYISSFDTYFVGENGSRLSGGQIQRIGIARALYRKPEILIFDEATNALDQKIEESIFQTIDKLRGKLTLFVISHDKTLKLNFDNIINI